MTAGNPYDWIEEDVLRYGILSYDSFAELRSFLKGNPTEGELKERFFYDLSQLSLLDEDKEILWQMLENWSKDKGLAVSQTVKLSLPFLTRLLTEGEAAIGEEATLSGQVVGQYLLNILEVMKLDAEGNVSHALKALSSSLDSLERPTIVGDKDQNALTTEDGYYIENFTYKKGKYQVMMLVSQKEESSAYPFLRGKTLLETTRLYFPDASFGTVERIEAEEEEEEKEGEEQGNQKEETASEQGNQKEETEAKGQKKIECLPFEYKASEGKKTVTGKAMAVWNQSLVYLFFVVTEKGWNEKEFVAWRDSVTCPASSKSISFEADMESDGAFYGINFQAQKYSINRVFFDEARFLVPKTGHGWAAERGNNLIDNIKGFIQGKHATVIGDDNAKNGADRVIEQGNTRLLIQTKYYASPSRGIASCFDENGYRYIDHVENRPMSVEVPADQYEQAVEYMKNRIANGEVPGVTDVEEAKNIVRKGNLTYEQARHIAQAGTVESILYDAANSCVVAGTSMGLSAAVSFAVNLWNGEPWDTSIKQSLLMGLRSGGTTFIISVLSSQMAKTGFNTAMIPASRVVVHAMGPKAAAVIVNAFRPAGSAIYGAAAMQSAAKLLRGNVITSTVTFAVLSAVDVSDIIRGRISWKQLAKNASTTAAGITGGTIGYLGGAAIGTALLPGAGTVAGLIVSVAAGWGAHEGAKAVADLIAEDDADEMIAIIERKFALIAEEYFLGEEEAWQAADNLQSMITPGMLKEMFQYKDHDLFARQLIEMSIDPVVASREYVALPSEEEYAEQLTDLLKDMTEEVSGEEGLVEEEKSFGNLEEEN